LPLDPLYKKIAALLLLAALFAQAHSKPFLLVDYYSNPAKYARHCENRDRPAMNCRGKCQLMKKMEEERQKDAGCPERQGEYDYQVPLSSRSFFTTVETVGGKLMPAYDRLPRNEGKSIDRHIAVFHPPDTQGF